LGNASSSGWFPSARLAVASQAAPFYADRHDPSDPERFGRRV